MLCSSGWTREEVKESSWALIQFKTRPRSPDRRLSAGSDGRTEETWFLVEEIVPADYRASLLVQAQVKPKSSRRISFLRPVRKKQSKQPTPVVPEISKPLGFFNRSSETVNRNNKPGLTPFRQTSPLRSGTPNLKTPDESVFAGGPTKIIKLSNSISSHGISKASSMHDDDLEAIDAPPIVIEKSEASLDAQGSQDGHGGLGYVKPSSTGSAFFDMVRKTTRRGNRRSLLSQTEDTPSVPEHPSVPSSPASTIMPGSPGFNLAEHGVHGPGRPIDHPNVSAISVWQSTISILDVRAEPSFARRIGWIEWLACPTLGRISVRSDTSAVRRLSPVLPAALKRESPVGIAIQAGKAQA